MRSDSNRGTGGSRRGQRGALSRQHIEKNQPLEAAGPSGGGSDASRTGLLPPAMTGGSVSFTLNGGGTLTVLDRDVQDVYEALWGISGESGAVTTAAYLMSQSRVRPYARSPIGLTIPESAALRKAVAGRAEQRGHDERA